MATSSAELRERLVQHAWNAWSHLDVPGWPDEAFSTCIDVDALVLLTGRLGDTDARSSDESLDWRASNLAFVSRTRLAHLLADGADLGNRPAYAADALIGLDVAGLVQGFAVANAHCCAE